MLSFFEFIAQSRKMTLPDTHTMLAMAGVSLDVPNEEETKRLMNREKKRPVVPMISGNRKATAPAAYKRVRPTTGTPGG
jgi:hypothetical protein